MNPPNHMTPWTKKDVLCLVAWVKEGIDIGEVAKRLGRTVASARSCWDRRGEPQHRDYGHLQPRMERLARSGRSVRQIADALGVSYFAVQSRLQKAGVRAPDGRRTPEARRACRERLERWRLEGRSGECIRVARLRRQAEAAGWPMADNPNEALLLGVLLRGGPMTKHEIASALGEVRRRGKYPMERRLRKMVRFGYVARGERPTGGSGGPWATYDLAPWVRRGREDE